MDLHLFAWHMFIVVHPHLENIPLHTHIIAKTLHSILIRFWDPPSDSVCKPLHPLLLVGCELCTKPLLLGWSWWTGTRIMRGRFIIIIIFLFLLFFHSIPVCYARFFPLYQSFLCQTSWSEWVSLEPIPLPTLLVVSAPVGTFLQSSSGLLG